MIALLLFPNQLFDHRFVYNRYDKIYFIEDHLYYGFRSKRLLLNHVRLAYMYVTHQMYVKYMKKRYGSRFVYIDYDKAKSFDYAKLAAKYKVSVYDPADNDLSQKLSKFRIKITDSLSFIANRKDIQSYRRQHPNAMRHNVFYKYMKSKINILVNVDNQDKFNRQSYSRKIEDIKYTNPLSNKVRPYTNPSIWLDAIKWINKHKEFSGNMKPLIPWPTLIKTYLTKLPVTHDQVHLWFNLFLKDRFKHYGTYQDVVKLDNPLLFHSGLSIFLNNGLIFPHYVVVKAYDYYKRHKKTITLASCEGFIRQVLGWREYSYLYYYYACKDNKLITRNHFKFSRHKLPRSWYNGTTADELLNKCIQYAVNYGYINHIQRLMIVSNYMLLHRIHPDNLYKWMFEFSLDSYEWVMIFNCYSMGSFSDGGFAMHKPYICGSNYLRKMCNYKLLSHPKSIYKWDDDYKKFVKRYKIRG
jgi:deoxyribodipyrimidine photolyase-related protein